jgi:hypothetical protein
LANEHADEGIGFLRKVPWVLSLSGDSFGTFLSTRREKYRERTPQQTAIYTANGGEVKPLPRIFGL